MIGPFAEQQREARKGFRDPVNKPRVYYPEARIVLRALFDGFGPETPVSFPAVPISIDLVLNGYDQPDSWSIEFDHKDLPISPELVRACAAEVYIFDRGALAADVGDIHEPIIAGLADSIDVTYDEGGRTVKIDGQDYTAIFIERGWRTNSKGNPDPIPVGRIDQVIELLVHEVSSELSLDLRLPRDLPPAKLPKIGMSTTRVIRDGFHSGSEANYWSVISKMATQHGFMVFVEGTRVVLTTAGAAYRTGEKVFEVEWGRNLTSLSMERKMGRERAPQIEVRAYDDETRTTRVVRYPDTKKHSVKTKPPVLPKGTKKPPPAITKTNFHGVASKGPAALDENREERRVFRIYGVKDEATLMRLARSAHEELGRGEFKIKFTTEDMADRHGLRFLEMRAGAQVQPIFDPLWEEMRKMGKETRYAFLREKHYPTQVASFLAENYTALAAFREAMYLREARVSFRAGEFSVEGEVVNFIKPVPA